MIASKVYDGSNNFGSPEYKKSGYDDTYEDAQLLHQCMTKRLKREDDPDYDPDLHVDGDSIRPNSAGQYFQKPIFQCPECVRSYKSPVRMANHYRDKHPEKDHRSPYARYSHSQRDKRQYDTSPPRSPDVDNSLPYSPFDYAHKHMRNGEREKFTANENTSLIINPYARHSPAMNNARTNNNSSPNHTSSYTNALIVTPPASSVPPQTSSQSSPATSPSRSPVVSPTASPPHPPSFSGNPTPATNSGNPKNRESVREISADGKKITVNGRAYECKGIKISTVVDEVKFVECLEKNKQRLHLANIAFSQGLISPEEYSRKQREFLSAFSFF